MDNKVLNEMQKRLYLLDCRLNALEKERQTLLKERELLEPLMKHYDSMPYDSIEEERRVTQQIAATSIKSEPNRGGRKTGQSKYQESLECAIENTGKEWSTNADITAVLNELLDKPIRPQQVFNLLKAQIASGRVIKHGNFYKLNVGE